jgi:hypothetical protein
MFQEPPLQFNHILRRLIDHLAGVITDHPGVDPRARSQKVDPSHGWPQLVVIESPHEEDHGPYA